MTAKLVALLALVWAILAPSAAAAQEKAGVYTISDVTVVPMDRERLITGQTVVIRDGRIESIGPASRVRVPNGATRIEGRGRYLMPGLAEMHAHVPPNIEEAQWTRDVLYLYVANGITFARSMLGGPHHLELRARAEKRQILSPRLHLSGPSLNGNSVATPEEGRRMVREQKAAGYDFLKIHPGLDRPRYDAIADEARRIGIGFGGHVPEDVGLARALEAGQAAVDHLDAYMPMLVRDGPSLPNPGFFGYKLAGQVDEGKIADVAATTRRAGVWNVPTESLIHHVLLPGRTFAEMEARPELRYVPRPLLAQWRQGFANFRGDDYDAEAGRRFVAIRAKLIKALNDAGAGLLLGSDAPQVLNVPGFSIHHELRALVEAGLTPYEALRTGTVNVVQFVGQPGDFGVVKAGARADLILLDADPLRDVANVQRRSGVMLGGRWLPEQQIQADLARIANRYRQ